MRQENEGGSMEGGTASRAGVRREQTSTIPILKPEDVVQRRRELQSDKGRWLRQRQRRYWSGVIGGLLVVLRLGAGPVGLLLPTAYPPRLNGGPHRFVILVC